MPTLTMIVNGAQVTREVEAETLLVQFLREHLRLTGTHIGCDTTQCGACTVHLDGQAIKSCTALALSCDGGEVTTIEGISRAGELHPMQQAFRANHGLQCGYCTPGFVMSAIKMVERLGAEFEDEALREEMEGNICRCTGYHNILKSIRAGAQAMAQADR
jgi:carbon-monoxide dehydrogenase small subunit